MRKARKNLWALNKHKEIVVFLFFTRKNGRKVTNWNGEQVKNLAATISGLAGGRFNNLFSYSCEQSENEKGRKVWWLGRVRQNRAWERSFPEESACSCTAAVRSGLNDTRGESGLKRGWKDSKCAGSLEPKYAPVTRSIRTCIFNTHIDIFMQRRKIEMRARKSRECVSPRNCSYTSEGSGNDLTRACGRRAQEMEESLKEREREGERQVS